MVGLNHTKHVQINTTSQLWQLGMIPRYLEKEKENVPGESGIVAGPSASLLWLLTRGLVVLLNDQTAPNIVSHRLLTRDDFVVVVIAMSEGVVGLEVHLQTGERIAPRRG